MRKWIIKQFDKLGLDTSNLKTQAKLNQRVLEYGEIEKIIFPFESNQKNDWRIKKWFFDKGKRIEYGNIICSIENEEQQVEFEAGMSGRLNYFKLEGQKVEKGTVLAEITGEKE